MPILNWIGKDKIINHHLEVPFRVLDLAYGFSPQNLQSQTATNSGNKIIHGDNLLALKSLLCEYEGKIKCIYIDPPYNTGNEGWVYNDNVNDPKIKKWLGQAVGKEAEDLSRHDKWLCMMYPRLKLLHKLLADDGAIFISIDDNELANLRLMMDEIFGQQNFVATFVRRRRKTQANLAKNVAPVHEYAVCFCKKSQFFNLKKIPYSEEFVKKSFSNPDNDLRGVYQTRPIAQPDNSSNKEYVLKMPNGREIKAKWSCSQETFNRYIEEKRLVIPRDGNGMPRIKIFLFELEGQLANTWLEDVSTNDEASKEIENIFGSNSFFSYPKPTGLIKKILQIATDKNSIILDSFAGSGTTAQAVLNLNQEDGGNRKFILIEMQDYAKNITAARVERVICGYGEGQKAVAGLGGEFDFFELGAPLFIGENNEFLNEEINLETIRQYVWYSETKSSYQPNFDIEKSPYFLGKKDQTAYYFIYEKDALTTLNYEILAQIKTTAEQFLIYADNCLLGKDFMAQNNIIFKKIPRDITRF